MKLAYNNIFDEITINISSENPDFPAVNLQNPHLAKYWRGTGASTETITFITSTLNPTCAFLAGTNLTNSAVVKIQGNNTDSWSTPNVDIVMELNKGVYYSYSNELTAQDYWRFEISDTGNPDGYIQAGRAWIGASIEVLGPYTSFVEKRINTSISEISNSGQVYGNINYKYKTYEMAYPYWDNTEKDNIEDFADTVNKSQPFFTQFVNDANCVLGPLYCIMTNDMEFTHLKTLDIWASKINFREVK